MNQRRNIDLYFGTMNIRTRESGLLRYMLITEFTIPVYPILKVDIAENVALYHAKQFSLPRCETLNIIVYFC